MIEVCDASLPTHDPMLQSELLDKSAHLHMRSLSMLRAVALSSRKWRACVITADIRKFSSQNHINHNPKRKWLSYSTLILSGSAVAVAFADYKGFQIHHWLIAKLSDSVIMPLIRTFLDPEKAHELAVFCTSNNLIPKVRSSKK